MPTYEYRCPECGTVFEQDRPMRESSAPATCPDGHPGAVRLLSVFAAVGSRPNPSGAPSEVPPGPCGSACACYPN